MSKYKKRKIEAKRSGKHVPNPLKKKNVDKVLKQILEDIRMIKDTLYD